MQQTHHKNKNALKWNVFLRNLSELALKGMFSNQIFETEAQEL